MCTYPTFCRRASLLAALLCALAPAAAAQNEVIVVNDSPDRADFPAPRRVAQLPGPDGRVTFREAVIAASNTPGPQTIAFNVPQSRWDPLFPNGALIFSDINPFFLDGDGTTVDGTTQTAFTGDTNPDGNEVAFWGEHPNALGSPMIIVHSDNNTFVGLDAMHRRGYGISLADDAEGNRVIGCTISGPLYAAVRIEGSRNTIGGTAPGEGNRLSSGNAAIRVEPSFGAPPPTDNRIIGNDLTGAAAGVQINAGAVGTVIGGPSPAERNVIAGAGNYGEEGFPGGVQVSVGGSTGTVIEGNYIGTTADGLAAAPSQIGTRGISIQSAPNTVIRNNVVSGILVEGIDHAAGRLFGVGIEVGPGSPGTVVVGNRIGVGADGLTPVPNLQGMEFTGGSEAPVTVGGTVPGDGNVIAHNLRTGVSMWAFIKRVSVLSNAVFDNGLLGIDLEDFDGLGFTANDLHDPDEQGANRLQNHPVIESAALNGGALAVTYSVDTAPANAAYPLRVEFFRGDGDGEEGAVFLGADTYTAADYAAGQPGSKTVALDVSGLLAGDLVLGTATDAAGNTSEFGAPAAVSGDAAPVAVSAQPVGGPVVIGPDGGSFRFTVTLTNTTDQPQTFHAWTAAEGPVDRSPVLGPLSVTLGPGGSVTRTLTQQVPAQAPAGTYRYAVNVGDFPGLVRSSASFPVVKEGAALAARGVDAGEDWTVSGWDEALANAAAEVPTAFALSAPVPNPARGSARLTLALPEAQRGVTVAVYDALGRRVALLHEGALGAGTHPLVLDASGWAPGLYVVRAATDGGLALTRRLVVAR